MRGGSALRLPLAPPSHGTEAAPVGAFERPTLGITCGVLAVQIIGMALLVRDALGFVALVALFVIAVNQSERTMPRWLRRRGYPPPLYLQSKEGRQRLTQLIRGRHGPKSDEEDTPD